MRRKGKYDTTIAKADAEQKRLLKKEAEASLLKLIQGYSYKETKTVAVLCKNEENSSKGVIKEVIETKKHVPPSPQAIIFTLTNIEPRKWNNT